MLSNRGGSGESQELVAYTGKGSRKPKYWVPSTPLCSSVPRVLQALPLRCYMDFSLSHWKHPSVSASHPGGSTPNVPIAIASSKGWKSSCHEVLAGKLLHKKQQQFKGLQLFIHFSAMVGAWKHQGWAPQLLKLIIWYINFNLPYRSLCLHQL